MFKGGMGNIMKQAQKMQEQMQQAQEELAKQKVTGESGGGMVKVTMNGKHEIHRVEIDDALMGDDKEMLEDLVAAACNDAVKKVASSMENSMSDLTSGLNLPPGMKLPF